MNLQFYPRLFLFMVAFAWGIALSAQPRVEAPHITIETPDAPLVSLHLAGLPRPGAAPGQRVFFTVQEDVFQNDTLFIAAGARAKGWIRDIRQTDTTLFLTVEMEAVQMVEGEMMGLVREVVSMEFDLEKGAWKDVPFFVQLKIAKAAADSAEEVGNVFRVP